jgi:hypothetical protein
MAMSKVLDVIAFERLLYIDLEVEYGIRHAVAALNYLGRLADRLEVDDYLDILESLVDGEVDLDDDLIQLIDASPACLYVTA